MKSHIYIPIFRVWGNESRSFRGQHFARRHLLQGGAGEMRFHDLVARSGCSDGRECAHRNLGHLLSFDSPRHCLPKICNGNWDYCLSSGWHRIGFWRAEEAALLAWTTLLEANLADNIGSNGGIATGGQLVQ